ncbi:MAG: CBS domain-containing protein [Sulfolobaceae archaeon]|jgi:CBS domain-containing protein
MKVREIVDNTIVIKVSPSTRLKDALELMTKQGTNFLIIVNDKDETIGVVTKSTILRSLANGIKPNESLSKVIIKSVLKADDSDDLLDVFINMIKNNSNVALAINGNGKVIGIVTLRDILYALNKECETLRQVSVKPV